MVKINKHIEIVASSGPGLNCMGPKTRKMIQAILSKKYAHVGITMVNNIEDLVSLASMGPDMVFLGTKFIPSNPELGLSDPHKIWLSKYFDERGIRYTGSSHEAIELELNKELAKQCVASAGIRTAPFQVIRQNEQFSQNTITVRYPLFVKPTNRGGGAGVDADSLVYNFIQLRAKVQSLSANLQSDSLVEEYLPGREFSVAILKEPYTDQYSIMPIELVAPSDPSGARFLSAQIKSADTEYCLKLTDGNLKQQINTLAIGAFIALGARDYGRIDVRLDSNDVPHFLEANLLPCLLNDYGNFPKSCLLNSHLEHGPVILEIASLALTRNSSNDSQAYKVSSNRNIISPSAYPEPALKAI